MIYASSFQVLNQVDKINPDWPESCTMQQEMQTCEEEVNWVNFRKRFLEKYFPDSARHEREAEFLTLQ